MALRVVGGAARGAIAEQSGRGRPGNGRVGPTSLRPFGPLLVRPLRWTAARIALCAGLVLLGVHAIGIAAAEGDGPHPALGMQVPNFTLPDMAGGTLRLAEVEEPIVVLNLFAFWCDTWIEQLPQLRGLAARQDELGFRLISISVDGRWSDRLAQVCGDDPPPFPVLLDSDRSLSGLLGLRHVPTVIILGPERRARFVYEGYPGNHVVLRAIRRTASTWLEAPSAAPADAE